MTLVETLAISTANQRVVSPLLCGSHPYPYGSLTYRFFILTILLLRTIVNPKWLFLKISFYFIWASNAQFSYKSLLPVT